MIYMLSKLKWINGEFSSTEIISGNQGPILVWDYFPNNVFYSQHKIPNACLPFSCHHFTTIMNSLNQKSYNAGRIGTKCSPNVIDRHVVWMKYISTLVELWPVMAIQEGKMFWSSRKLHDIQDSIKNKVWFMRYSFKNVPQAWNKHNLPGSTQIRSEVPMIWICLAQ